MSAPGRARRGKPGKSNLSISTSANGGVVADGPGEVLFDEDMSDSAGSRDGAKTEDRRPLMSASGPSSSSHSRGASRSRD